MSRLNLSISDAIYKWNYKTEAIEKIPCYKQLHREVNIIRSPEVFITQGSVDNNWGAYLFIYATIK